MMRLMSCLSCSFICVRRRWRSRRSSLARGHRRRRTPILAPQRHGGGAGAARRPHRRRDSRPRRQRGRRRGRGRLRARGHLSARRQYRRRRLHGDPSRRAAIATSRSTIARPRRRRRRRPCFSTRKAIPIRQSRAIQRLAIGVPGTVAGLALAHEKYGSGKFSLADLIAPAISWRARAFRSRTIIADSLPRARERLARWPSSAEIFLKNGGQPLHAGDRLVQFDLADTLQAIAEQGPARLLSGRRSPTRSPPRCAPPAAS